MVPRLCLFPLLAVLTSAALTFDTAAQDAAVAAPPKTENKAPTAAVPEGINDRFKDPELDVSEWIGRFEIESREVYSARERVLDICSLKPGMAVADIGAGTGFYSRLFAETVGESGRVYSVDIAPGFLTHIRNRADKEGLTWLTTVQGSDRQTNLPPESVDLIFICDTYHHFEFPADTMTSALKALRPGGILVLIDFERIPGTSREFILGHVRAGKEVFRAEVESAGFQFLGENEVPGFVENYLLRFQKPEAPSSE